LRRASFAAIILLVSLVFAIAIAELAVRAFFPQKLSVDVTHWDPDVGFTNIPGAEGYAETAEYRMHISINSRGLRDREFDYAKPPRTLRVGVFGDSFTFGEGVQNDETYAKRLEVLLQRDHDLRAAGVNVEVLNFGIDKTGTSHQLALYRKEGRKYGLDVVVVGFFGENDFGDNWAGVYTLQHGALVHNPAAYSSVRRIQPVVMSLPFYRWAAAHSHLVNLLRAAATLLDDAQRTRHAESVNTPQPVPDRPDLDPRQEEMTLRLVEAFREEAERDGARFVLLTIPQQGQKPLTHYTKVSAAPPFVSQLDRLLNDLERDAFEIVDLVRPFEESPSASHYYFVNDGHFNPRGHEAAAQILGARLLPDLVRRARP